MVHGPVCMNFSRHSDFYSISVCLDSVRFGFVPACCSCSMSICHLKELFKCPKHRENPLRETTIMEPFTCSNWNDDTLLGIIFDRIWGWKIWASEKESAHEVKKVLQTVMRSHMCLCVRALANCGWCTRHTIKASHIKTHLIPLNKSCVMPQ